MLLDLNGNGVADVGEPTAITDTNGRFELEVGGGEAAQSSTVLLPSDSCVDSYTGKTQTIPLSATPGSKAISPLSQMIKEIAEDMTTVDALGRRRRLQEGEFPRTPAQAMELLKEKLGLNISDHQIGGVDLTDYQPFEQLKEGKDVCVGAGMITRTSQVQALAVQLSTVVTSVQGGTTLSSASRYSYLALARFISDKGFASLSSLEAFMEVLEAAVDLSLQVGLLLGRDPFRLFSSAVGSPTPATTPTPHLTAPHSA